MKYGEEIGDGYLLVEVLDELVLEGKIPMDGVDWRHTRELSLEEWQKRASRFKPDTARVYKGNRRCTECGLVIPVLVLAMKDGNVIDSWGGVLFGDTVVCDDCSPI